MALSEQERQILEQMERELRREDPELASAMSDRPEPFRPSRKTYSPRRVATGIVVAVIGLAFPLIGITIGITWLAVVMGVIGFVLMLGGVLLIAVPTQDSDKPVKERPVKDSSSFRERQQRKWDERRQQ